MFLQINRLMSIYNSEGPRGVGDEFWVRIPLGADVDFQILVHSPTKAALIHPDH